MSLNTILCDVLVAAADEELVLKFLEVVTGVADGGVIALEGGEETPSLRIGLWSEKSTQKGAAAAASGVGGAEVKAKIVLVEQKSAEGGEDCAKEIASMVSVGVPTVGGVFVTKELRDSVDLSLFEKTTRALPMFYGACVAGQSSATPSDDGSTADSTDSLLSPHDAVIKRMRDMLLYPVHMLFNGETLTQGAQKAFLRTFWILDTDCNGSLSSEETRKWLEMMPVAVKMDFENPDSDLRKALSANQSNFFDGQLTSQGFLAVQHFLIAKGLVREVWRLLHRTGTLPTPETFPFPSARLYLEEANLQPGPLGSVAIAFLRSVFTRGRKIDPWSFAAECPWEKTGGLASPYTSSSRRRGGSTTSSTPPPQEQLQWGQMNVHQFIDGWRLVAWENPDSLVRFALHWGFKGDPVTLIDQSSTVKLKTILVLGSPGCGKSSLLQRLSPSASGGSGAPLSDDASPEDDSNRFGLGEERQALLLEGVGEDQQTTLRFIEPNSNSSDSGLRYWLSNEAAFRSVNAVLLLLDGTDPYSFSFLMNTHNQLAQAAKRHGVNSSNSGNNNASSSIACLVVLTKADLPTIAPVAQTTPVDFCASQGLLWPPVITSVVEDNLMGLKNDINQLVDQLLPPVLADPSIAPLVSGEVSAGEEKKKRKNGGGQSPSPLPLVIGIVVGAVVVGGFLMSRRRKN